MNVNPNAYSSGACSQTKPASEQSGSGNANGTSVTFLPGTSTEGLRVDSNLPGASSYTPFNLDEIMESLAFADDDTQDSMDPPKENEPEQTKYKLTTFDRKVNEAETAQKVDENDGTPVQRNNIYDTITIEQDMDMDMDMDMGDYIQLPDVTEYKKLMLNESFNKIKLQFLTDINELKSLVHFFVNHQYDNKISTFYKKIEENRQVFHVDFFMLYKNTRRRLRCLIVKLKILQDNETIKDYIAAELHKYLEDIDHCLLGVHARFMTCHIDINASKAGLGRKLLTVRTELFKQCITSFILLIKELIGLNIWLSRISIMSGFMSA